MKKLIIGLFGFIVLSSLVIFMTASDMSEEEILRSSFESSINRNRFFSENDPTTGVDRIDGLFFNNKLKMLFPVDVRGRDDATVVETSSYFKLRNEGTADEYNHRGTDIATYGNLEDVQTVACVSGTIIKVERDPDASTYGVHVKLQELSTGIVFIYAHLLEDSIETVIVDNYHIEAGDPIGIVGNTGNSRGIHLHFEANAPGIESDYFNPDYRGTIDPFSSEFFIYDGSTIPLNFDPGYSDMEIY